jgi:ABC-2 type transport system ATP-binding protein
MTSSLIEARALTRSFGSVPAVRGLDLDVREGELVAFLGPNGAGKSTSVRMLTTLLAPTSGTATVAGCDIATDPGGVRRRIGYVGQGNGAGPAQRVADELVSQGRAYGLAGRQAAARAAELLDALELGALAKRKVQTLSGGQRRRLDVALGLVHRPRLLFLDEPSTGLDPQSRANLWAHVLRLRAAHGMTIFLTTHYLDEADTMAERVMVMDRGQVIADDTADRLKSKHVGERVVVRASTPAGARRLAAAIGSQATDVSVDGRTMTARVEDGPASLPALLRAVPDVVVESAEVRRATLDDVFLALTGRTSTEEKCCGDRVGEGGLEPPRGCPHWHLKPARLPFRHSPEWS